MSKIVLAQDTSSVVDLDMPGRCLCVFHRAYEPPPVGERMPFDEFRERPRAALRGIDSLLLVGMNRMINPGNRTQMVFEVIHNNTSELPKVSLDRTLFVSEPWRIWFHFGAVSERYLDFTYSYIAESRYNAWLEKVNDDNPFDLNTVVAQGKGLIRSLDQSAFDAIEVETQSMTKAIHAEYHRLKKELFVREKSAKGIIRELSSYAKSVCPDRRIPTPRQLFDRRRWTIRRTDLPVDEWLVSELRRFVDLSNGIAASFYEGS